MNKKIILTKEDLETGKVATCSLIGQTTGLEPGKDTIDIELPVNACTPERFNVYGYTIISMMNDVAWLARQGFDVVIQYKN